MVDECLFSAKYTGDLKDKCEAIEILQNRES